MKSGVAFLDDKRGYPFRSLVVIRDGHGDTYFGKMAVGYEGLGAIKDPTAIPALGHSARSARIGTSFRLGQGPAAEFLALRERRDVFFPLLFASKFENMVCAQRIVRSDDQTDRAVDASEFLDYAYIFDVPHSRAAVLLG